MTRPVVQNPILRVMRQYGFPVSRKAQIVVFMVFKLILMGFFSSAYQHQLFMPFVTHFVQHGGDPWQYFWQHPELGIEFPYHPLMLYILTPFAFIIQALHLPCDYCVNLIFKLPTLLADGVIAFSLLHLFPDRGKNIIFFYVLSPIIFYACYLHSQLDLIPTAFLFLAIQLLKEFNWRKSAVVYGLALAIKLHVLAVFPLMAIYLLRNNKQKTILWFSIITLGVYLFFTAPYLNSAGFEHMVLSNQKQANIFEFAAVMANNQIYWVLFALLLLYVWFFLYKKVNSDLLDAYTALVFSVFLLLVVPSPGWYVWLTPFLSLLLIKNFRKRPVIAIPYNLLGIAYAGYFLFFHVYNFQSLDLMGTPVALQIHSPMLRNIAFTVLEAMLFATLLMSYRIGVLSNTIYGRAGSMIIGIGGDSGTGKTTLLADLRAILGKQLLDIEGDGDHKWERGNQNWQTFTHLDPKANFLHRQTEAIQTLKNGQPVFRSDYDHHDGRFTEPKEIKPKEYISLSGLHPFYLPKLRKLIDLKIYLDPQTELKYCWKINRDMSERGHSKEKILEQIKKREGDAEKHIHPQRDFADLVIRYQPVSPIDLEHPDQIPPIELMVSVDSSLNFDKVVEELQQLGYPVEWDYAEDLSSQFLRIPEAPKKEDILHLCDNLIPNPYEITFHAIDWQDGYRGFIQFLVLFMLSDLKKGKMADDI